MIAYRQCLSELPPMLCGLSCCGRESGAEEDTSKDIENFRQWQPMAARQQTVSKRGRHWLKLSRKRYRRRKIYYNCRSQETNEYFMLCKSTRMRRGSWEGKHTHTQALPTFPAKFTLKGAPARSHNFLLTKVFAVKCHRSNLQEVRTQMLPTSTSWRTNYTHAHQRQTF